MNYWIMKAKRSATVVAEWVQEEGIDTWWTKRRPTQLIERDRLLVWKGGVSPFLIGMAECLGVHQSKDRAGRYTFCVRYLTDAFEPKLTIERLRRDPVLKEESFLKIGPAGTLFPLTPKRGRHLESLIRRMKLANPESFAATDVRSPRSIPDLDIRTTGERIRERKLRAHIKKSEALRCAAEGSLAGRSPERGYPLRSIWDGVFEHAARNRRSLL